MLGCSGLSGGLTWRMGDYCFEGNGSLRLSTLQQGKGLVKVNGQPLSLVQPEILRFKVRISHPIHIPLLSAASMELSHEET